MILHTQNHDGKGRIFTPFEDDPDREAQLRERFPPELFPALYATSDQLQARKVDDERAAWLAEVIEQDTTGELRAVLLRVLATGIADIARALIERGR